MRVNFVIVKTVFALAFGLCAAQTAAETRFFAGNDAPASTSIRDLVAFVNKSGYSRTTIGDGVTRKQRTTHVNGKEVTVAVDSLAGYGNGLVQYRRGDNVYLYTVAGEPIANIKMPSGNYVGPLTLNYRVAKGKPMRVAVGDMGMALHMDTGKVSIGGIVGDSHNVIEFYGDAKVKGGAFTATNSIVRLRNGEGEFVRDYKGTVNGTLATGKKGSAVFGTVRSGDVKTGWKLRGGYSAVKGWKR